MSRAETSRSLASASWCQTDATQSACGAQAGEILIKEGDTGLGASELYVVKAGEFEVLERRQGAHRRRRSQPLRAPQQAAHAPTCLWLPTSMRPHGARVTGACLGLEGGRETRARARRRREHARERQSSRRLLRRGVADVLVPALGDRGRDAGRGGVGA